MRVRDRERERERKRERERERGEETYIHTFEDRRHKRMDKENRDFKGRRASLGDNLHAFKGLRRAVRNN
jgi:hypothetical protein